MISQSTPFGALLGATALWLLAAGAAAGTAPVAIVEDIEANGAGVSVMDYVEPGRVISLGSKDRLVLGYLRSCRQETIVGGRVRIGRDKSVVSGGRLDWRTVDCNGGKLVLTPQQAEKSGVLVFRGLSTKAPETKPANAKLLLAFKIYSTVPVITAPKQAGRVTIVRLDRKEAEIAADLKGGYFDLGDTGRALAPGGLYRVSGSGRSVVFKIDPAATPGKGPVVGRLISL